LAVAKHAGAVVSVVKEKNGCNLKGCDAHSDFWRLGVFSYDRNPIPIKLCDV
jgi:hypothetical protein